MRTILLRTVLLGVICAGSAASAQSDGRWYKTVFGGNMTANRSYEVFFPADLDLVGSQLIGVGVGWDRRIGQSRFSYGFEAQAIRHFGRQEHYEFNLPVLVRYAPKRPVFKRLKTVSFGIGVSHATEIPQVEIDRKGASQRNFVYWMADAEFSLPRRDTSWFFRLHHRSDGYGTYDVSSGSTALVLGLRKDF